MKIRSISRCLAIILCLCLGAAGCGAPKDSPQVSVSKLLNRVKEAYGESYAPQMPLDTQALEQRYGLSGDMYVEALGETSLISVMVDEFVAVRAQQGRADDVEAALEDYRDYLVNEAVNYPMNTGKINGSLVYRNGNYVFFIMLGDMPQEVADGSPEEARAYAARQNEIAVEVIDELLE